MILHLNHKGADCCSTDERKLINNVIRAEARKPIKSEDINPLYLTLSLLFVPPSLPSFLPTSPLGGGSSPGWGSALGVWWRVCLSERGTVLPLQGPLGAALGYTHLGEHQVRTTSANKNRRCDAMINRRRIGTRNLYEICPVI